MNKTYNTMMLYTVRAQYWFVYYDMFVPVTAGDGPQFVYYLLIKVVNSV